MWFFRREARYKTIDDQAGKAVLRLHEEHPEMGRRRLEAALAAAGIDLDSRELKRFLRSHKIGTPPPTRQARLPWGQRHVPSHPWLRYRR